MYPKQFDYFVAQNLKQAISLLRKYNDSKILAGGQSLLALMKLRLAEPKYLVDIGRIPKLTYIRPRNGGIAIGAMTTHDTIEISPLVRSRFSVLSEAASQIGDQQIRNRGTLGGSICHADPASDMPPVMLVLNARLVALGPRKERVIPAEQFFVDLFTTALKDYEVLREIRIPALPPRSGSAYMKFTRRHGDFAIVGVAAVLTVDKKNVCEEVRIGLCSVGSTATRAKSVEKTLLGKVVDDKNIEEASQLADEGTDPPSDIHGSAEYRKAMAKVFTKRALKLAFSRIGGKS